LRAGLLNPNLMRILLQNTITAAYFESPDKWTPNRNEALDFGDTERAVKLAYELKLEHVQVLLTFESSQPDVILPLHHI